MKLHLGCGAKLLTGWVNCDAQEREGVDIVSLVQDMLIQDGSVDEVYACHFIEHFGRHEVIGLFQKISGWIKPGGKIWIAVPDFKACVTHYQDTGNLNDIMGLLMGGQNDSFDYHKYLFDFNSLSNILVGCGFENIEKYNRDDHAVGIQGIDDYSAAYLPHMDKTGLLMSLNVVATKK